VELHHQAETAVIVAVIFPGLLSSESRLRPSWLPAIATRRESNSPLPLSAPTSQHKDDSTPMIEATVFFTFWVTRVGGKKLKRYRRQAFQSDSWFRNLIEAAMTLRPQ
jgi:hypothetical protein